MTNCSAIALFAVFGSAKENIAWATDWGEASVCWLNPSGGYNGVGLERIGGFDLPHVIWITSVEEERDEVDNYIVVTGPYRRRAC